METYESFTAFLEGTINKEDEQKLFSEMHFDEDLRSQFRRFVAIDRTFKSTSGIYVPPPDVTNKVFAGLALTAPFAEPAPKTTLGNAFLKTALIKNVLIGFCSALVAVFGTYYFTYNNNNENKNTIITYQTENKPKADKSDALPPSTQITQNSQSQANQKVKYIYIQRQLKENNLFEESNSDVKNNKTTELHFDKRQLIASNIKYTFRPMTKSISLPTTPIQQSKQVRYDNDSKLFNLEIEQSPSWFSSNPKINPEKQNGINNTGIALAYNLSEEFKIGAKVKFETFYLIYDDENETQKAKYYQQPNLITIGANVKYKPLKPIWGFEPFVKTEFGINSFGFVTREELGFDFNLGKNIYMFFGAGFNQFFYKHSNTNFNSGKYSLIYGIGVGL